MALPDSRNTTYAAGSEVKSADLNDIQDQIIALDNVQEKVIIAPGHFINEPGDLADIQQTQIKLGDGIGATRVSAPIPVRVGNVIKSALAYVQANGGADAVTVNIDRVPRAGVVITNVATANSAAAGEIALAAINHTVLEDNAYTVSIDNNPTGGDTVITYVEILIART